MRRLLALLITIALAWIVVTRLGAEPDQSAALALGFALLCAAIVGWLYESALSRPPTAAERATAMQLLGSPPTLPGVEDLLWAVFMLPEFQIVR